MSHKYIGAFLSQPKTM